MIYDEIPATLRQAVGCWEGFRKMGFSAGELYLEIGPTADDTLRIVFMTLKSRRGRIFRVGVGSWLTAQEDALAEQWRALCAAVTGGQVSQTDLDRIWEESFVCKDKVGFAMVLVARGLTPPRGLA